MKTEHFDVLIVGAGPAGSFAAERLAQGGVRVALFDGRPPGEPKACGGGVTAKALKAWPHLLQAVGRTVDELEMYSPSGRRLHMKLDEPFAIYSRVAFDSYLRDRARDAGASLFFEKISPRATTKTETVWKLKSGSAAHGADAGNNSHEWSGSVLVGADGANSAIARKLAGPLKASDMEVAFGYRAPLPEQEHAPTVIAFLPKWVGYAWAFPRLDHISFGIATTQDAFEHRALDELLWRFMVGYYRQRENAATNIWKNDRGPESSVLKKHLRSTAERYAARIPGLSDRNVGHAARMRRRLGAARRCSGLCRSGDRRRNLLRATFGGTLRGSVSRRPAGSVRAALARGFWRRTATRFTNAPALLWKLLGRAVYRTDD